LLLELPDRGYFKELSFDVNFVKKIEWWVILNFVFFLLLWGLISPVNIVIRYFKGVCNISAACLLMVAFFVFAGVSNVQAEGEISFSWSANPVEDQIIGYRLYLGQESRYDAENQLKMNFSYDYYIDFTSWEYCPADGDGYGCAPLPDGAVSCVDLFQENPKCTIQNSQNWSFFTLTAYNSQEESDYTPELNLQNDVNGNSLSPGQLATLQVVYSLLLH